MANKMNAGSHCQVRVGNAGVCFGWYSYICYGSHCYSIPFFTFFTLKISVSI